MAEAPRDWMPPAVFRQLLLDLDDRCRAEALRAHEMVRDYAGLDRKRGRELEGQARFRMMERGFQEVSELHGGMPLEGGLIPGTDLKVFQPFCRFNQNERGFVLGLAAIADTQSLPVKNRSRLAGVSLNFSLTARLDLGDGGPKEGDVFILLLVSRDKQKAGLLEEIAVGLIDSSYDHYLSYEPLDQYLAETKTDEPIVKSHDKQVVNDSLKLKKNVRPYEPRESDDPQDKKKQQQ